MKKRKEGKKETEVRGQRGRRKEQEEGKREMRGRMR